MALQMRYVFTNVRAQWQHGQVSKCAVFQLFWNDEEESYSEKQSEGDYGTYDEILTMGEN